MLQLAMVSLVGLSDSPGGRRWTSAVAARLIHFFHAGEEPVSGLVRTVHGVRTGEISQVGQPPWIFFLKLPCHVRSETRVTSNDQESYWLRTCLTHGAGRSRPAHLSSSLWKRPDARRLPDDTRRAPQPNRKLQAFGTAESNLGELRGGKRANRWTLRSPFTRASGACGI